MVNGKREERVTRDGTLCERSKFANQDISRTSEEKRTEEQSRRPRESDEADESQQIPAVTKVMQTRFQADVVVIIIGDQLLKHNEDHRTRFKCRQLQVNSTSWATISTKKKGCYKRQLRIHKFHQCEQLT